MIAVALGTVAGLIAGSFFATLIVRWSADQAMSGRSHCDNAQCGQTLGPLELVPLLSYLVQRGRCRRCNASIDATHPLIELACAGIGGLALAAAPNLAGIAGALFGWLLITLAVLDARHFILPDRLTGPLAALGLAGGAIGLPPLLTERLIGGIAGYAALAVVRIGYRTVRRREGMGGGDPKLFGAIGLWLGWPTLPLVLLGASLIGLALALVLWFAGRGVTASTRLPLGALLALAAWVDWLLIA